MFKNTLAEIFPFVQRMYDVDELILVGSDIASWLDIVSSYDLEKVHYINQNKKNYNFDSLPSNWQVSSKLLAKEDGETNFYTLSNPMLNGSVSSDLLVNLWQNLETFETTQQESISLKNFVENECSASGSKMVVLDSFDGLNVLDVVESLRVDVVVLRVVAGDEDVFENVSEQKVQQYFQEYGYKKIAFYEDNHPKVKTAVYVFDHNKQSKTLQTEKQSLEEKLQAVPELENKTKTLEESIDKEDFIYDIAPFFSMQPITYVDIGAYVGEVFKKFKNSKELRIREAHLYEANPESFKLLKENIAPIIKDSVVHAYNLVISDKIGSLNFLSAGSMTKQSQVSLSEKTTNSFEVNCTTLNQDSKKYTDRHVNLLQIDVEGEEKNVLKGAEKLLIKQQVDVIYIEVGMNIKGIQQTYFGRLDKTLQKFGYRIFKIYEQKDEWIQGSPLLRRCNIAYMSSEFAKAHPYRLTKENYKLKNEIQKIKEINN